MNIIKTIAAVSLSALMLTSCGVAGSGVSGMKPGQSTGTTGNKKGNASSVLGAFSQGGNASNVTSLVGSIIGALTGSSVKYSIVGTWTYSQPTVQFESENFLAQAGGMVAANTIVNKISPYYEKVGIRSGSMKLVFKEGNSCTITMGGNTIPTTYTYNANTGMLSFSVMGFNMSAYATLTANQLSLTFDSTKLMNLTQMLGAQSSNSTVSTLSGLLSNYKGMKTGFLFSKQ